MIIKDIKIIIFITLIFFYLYIIKYYPEIGQYNNNNMIKKEKLFKNKNLSNLNFFNSSDYWEKRYANGGNSGSGSYNNSKI